MPTVRQEITDWVDAPNTPNHIYITSGQTLIGLVPVGTTKAVYFSKPKRQWSPSRRKFRTLGKKELAELSL